MEVALPQSLPWRELQYCAGAVSSSQSTEAGCSNLGCAAATSLRSCTFKGRCLWPLQLFSSSVAGQSTL